MVSQWHPGEKRSPTMLFCPCINRLFDTHQFSHVNTQIVYFDVSGCSKRWQYDGTFGQSDCHIRYTNRSFGSLISGHSERWYYNCIPGQSAIHQWSFVYTLTPTTFFSSLSSFRKTAIRWHPWAEPFPSMSFFPYTDINCATIFIYHNVS